MIVWKKDLKALRSKEKFTLHGLGEACDLKHSAISAIEQGRNTNPKIQTLEMIASGLGYDLVIDFKKRKTAPGK